MGHLYGVGVLDFIMVGEKVIIYFVHACSHILQIPTANCKGDVLAFSNLPYIGRVTIFTKNKIKSIDEKYGKDLDIKLHSSLSK